jgi:hypothetical protein
MRKLKLQLMDDQGNIQDEKEIQVNENELLIMKYPKEMAFEQAESCFRGLKYALIEGKSALGIPDSITFEVLKIN